MKRNSQIIIFFLVLIISSALYRIIPYESRPVWLGAPQLALALLAGSVIRDRKWAFAIPLVSLLFSDLLMQGLHSAGLTPHYPGFYKGQMLNYALIALLTVVGFFVNSRKVGSVLTGMVTAPTLYFILSNFAVWVSGGGLQRPKTPAGLIQCYADAVPFYGNALLTMAVFGTLFFGGHYLLSRGWAARAANA